MWERIKIAFYALTKKEYVFYAIDNRDPDKRYGGAVAYYKTYDTKNNTIFLSCVQEDIENLKKEL